MKIAFRTDASSKIGTGHLSRCMTLADALSARGGQTTFICRDLDKPYATQIHARGHALLNLPTSTQHAKPTVDRLPHSHWLPVCQSEDAEAILATMDEAWDIIVVDHYALDARWEKMMRGRCTKILVIDDLADREHQCDFLVDQNLQSSAHNRYLKLAPSNCKFLLGTEYAILRPEFAYWASRHVRLGNRLNIFFGGIDHDGATVLALQALKSFPQLSADVIVGVTNPRLEIISSICAEMQEVRLLVQAENMAELFSQAQLALGAGGATSWERCCVGLPALVVSLAENQTKNCALLDLAGVAVNMGILQELSADTLVAAIHHLIEDPKRLEKMAERGRTLVDGNGTARIVNTVLNSGGAKT